MLSPILVLRDLVYFSRPLWIKSSSPKQYSKIKYIAGELEMTHVQHFRQHIARWLMNLRIYVVPVWTSYQIRKIAGCACAGNAGNVFPRRRLQRKPLVSDPGMHHGTCVTHVPWCMSGSFNCGDGENVPDIPGACAPAILRIWQEPHIMMTSYNGIFCVTGTLWGVIIHWWIPLTIASDAKLLCVRWSSPEQTFEQTIQTPVIWDTIVFIMTSL